MRTILFAFFFLTAFSGIAQNDNDVEFRKIRMPKFPVEADFPKKSIKVSDIRLIQTVRDSVRLGYAFKGMDNQVIILTPVKPLTVFLQQDIHSISKDGYKADGSKILWVLKELRLGEKTAFLEYAYTRFNADAYISGEGNQYKYVCTIDTVLIAESGADVTAWHGVHIEDAFRLLLKKTLQKAKYVVEDVSGGMAIEEIIAKSTPQTDIPILQDTIYREGAYANFEEFLQNKPSITAFESIVEKKKITFVRSAQNNNRDTLNIWGLCKNGEIYKYYEGALIPIEKQTNGFVISNYIEKTNRRNSNMFAGVLLGGLVGGAVANATSSSLRSFPVAIPYIAKKKQPDASSIDMKTGELSF